MILTSICDAQTSENGKLLQSRVLKQCHSGLLLQIPDIIAHEVDGNSFVLHPQSIQGFQNVIVVEIIE